PWRYQNPGSAPALRFGTGEAPVRAPWRYQNAGGSAVHCVAESGDELLGVVGTPDVAAEGDAGGAGGDDTARERDHVVLRLHLRAAERDHRCGTRLDDRTELLGR